MDTKPDVPDGIGDEVVEGAIALAEAWVRMAQEATSPRQRRREERLHDLMGDPDALRFAMAFLDRVIRAPNDRIAAVQLAHLVNRRGVPTFLGGSDRAMLGVGARIAPIIPGVVMPLARRRLRSLTDHLIVPADTDRLVAHLEARRRQGRTVNVNRLGEAVLGEDEANRRFHAVLDLLRSQDVDYVSVKVSAIASRLDLWDFDGSLDRICARLRPLYRTADASGGFVNLDMEEYRDLDLTIAAFRRVLDEPEFAATDAGIVLQAYLPDSFDRLRSLTEWANDRHEGAGGRVKIRIVKGANLAMERVEAELHGWVQAPYSGKHEVDANWKRMIDWVCTPARLTGVRLGVASHNLLDVAWAHLLVMRRNVAGAVEFEMLEGMAPAQADQVHRSTGTMLLYTPTVADADFASAVAYLFRRLEENAAPENFLRHLFGIRLNSEEWRRQCRAFRRAAHDRWEVDSRPRRRQNRSSPHDQAAARAASSAAFGNEPDTDPALAHNRSWAHRHLEAWSPPAPPDRIETAEEVETVVDRARRAAGRWAATTAVGRRRALDRLAAAMAAQRGSIIATMAHEAGKVVAEADPEVSEAIDFARWYGRCAVEFEDLRGIRSVSAGGVVVVTPPWNFPFAIPVGGMCAALAAGHAVVLKPAPQTVLTAAHIRECVDGAGLPGDLVQVIDCPENEVGRRLISHPGIRTVILTGGRQTAELFASWRPDLQLVAETNGKNAMIVTARADVDAAVADLVRSAFGHGGQKCSAASLAIVEAEIHDSPGFMRQLADATRSLTVGPAHEARADIGPLIGPPDITLLRGLTELDPGEDWLVTPERMSADGRSWRPGVRIGVQPGSWFHHHECFGPVLGVMRARDLDEAIRWQSEVAFGLTGGLWTLDPDQVETWLERVQVGNAYVNRSTTGAVVARQPFGGWKRSVVGPGAKAGGPNYVAQLLEWADDGPIVEARPPSAIVAALLDEAMPSVEPAARGWLESAAGSDAHWMATHFGVDHDVAGLVAESNVFRYRPLDRIVVRCDASTSSQHLVRVLAAALAAGVAPQVSSDAPMSLPHIEPMTVTVESEHELIRRLGSVGPRIRMLTHASPALRLAALTEGVHPDDRKPVAHGRLELQSMFREQSVSITRHRYGNLVGPA